MNPLSILLLALCIPSTAHAWLMPWNYGDRAEVYGHSDLVVIATLASIKETPDTLALTGESTFVDSDGTRHRIEPIMGLGVDATFKELARFKGSRPSGPLIVHLYKTQQPHRQGPFLVDLRTQEEYVLFLKRDELGRYVPATSQSNSSDAVLQLESKFDALLRDHNDAAVARYGESISRPTILTLFLICALAVAFLVAGSCLMAAIRSRSRSFQFAETIIGIMAIASCVINALVFIYHGTLIFTILTGVCATLQICMHFVGREISTRSIGHSPNH